jgi:hypothetical protein
MKTFQRPNFALYFQGDDQIFAELTKQDVLLLKSGLTEDELSHVYLFHPSQRDWVPLAENVEISEAVFEFQRNVKAPPPGQSAAASGPKPGTPPPEMGRSRPTPGPGLGAAPAGRPAPSGQRPPPSGPAGAPGRAPNAPNPFALAAQKQAARQAEPATGQAPPASATRPPSARAPGASPGAKTAFARPQSTAGARPASSAPAKGQAVRQAIPPKPETQNPPPQSWLNNQPAKSPTSDVRQDPKKPDVPPVAPLPEFNIQGDQTNPFHALKRSTRGVKSKSGAIVEGQQSPKVNPLIPLGETEIKQSGHLATGLPPAPPYRGRDVRNRRLLASVPRILGFRAPIIGLDRYHLHASVKWPLDPGVINLIQLAYLDQTYTLEGYIDPSTPAGDMLVLLDTKDYKYFLDLMEILGFG